MNRPETDGSGVEVVVYDDGVNDGGDDDNDDDFDHNDVSDIDDDDDDDCFVLCFFLMLFRS